MHKRPRPADRDGAARFIGAATPDYTRCSRGSFNRLSSISTSPDRCAGGGDGDVELSVLNTGALARPAWAVLRTAAGDGAGIEPGGDDDGLGTCSHTSALFPWIVSGASV
jgi:hypothetical protein